jgi:mono/diheme cytochrome c family protein
LFYKISEGNSPMPPYKASLTEAQRWDLVDYIRTLAKKSK